MGKKQLKHGDSDNAGGSDKKKKRKKKSKNGSHGGSERGGMNEPSSIFQRKRVDMLLDFWVRKFPPKITSAPAGPQPTVPASNPPSQAGGDKGEDIKSEKDVKSEKPSDQGSNVGFEATVASAAASRGVKREAVQGIKQETKKVKLS